MIALGKPVFGVPSKINSKDGKKKSSYTGTHQEKPSTTINNQ